MYVLVVRTNQYKILSVSIDDNNNRSATLEKYSEYALKSLYRFSTLCIVKHFNADVQKIYIKRNSAMKQFPKQIYNLRNIYNKYPTAVNKVNL